MLQNCFPIPDNGLSIIDIMTMVISVVNLLIVVWFFILSSRYDKNRHRFDTRNAWIKDVIIPTFIDQIKVVESQLVKIYDFDKDYDVFYTEFNFVQKRITESYELLNIINPSLYDLYFNEYSDFEDEVLLNFIQRKDVSANKFINNVIKLIYQEDNSNEIKKKKKKTRKNS